MVYKLNKSKYSAHEIALGLVDSKSKVLELGCNTGYLSRELKNRGCKVWGVDNNLAYLKEAKKYCEWVGQLDLDSSTNYRLIPKEKFDFILLMDVLEHLKDASDLLAYIAGNIKTRKIIISIPNIANLSIRMDLLFGKFNYTELGLLDKTHVKLYTLASAKKLITSSGLKIESINFTADLGLVNIFGRFLRKLPKDLQHFITKIKPTLLAGQFIYVCTL